ncbi:Hypothetical_protein [Hexamita inflata]|uniref:Hypothetical_protein n=1 Tax=Hexamita inflata TaxID=28002 RepID=A0AA86RF81_9EUKA|nr:Hypothetical protein HINF_LOCUS65029 [Hexamita inflata]
MNQIHEVSLFTLNGFLLQSVHNSSYPPLKPSTLSSLSKLMFQLLVSQKTKFVQTEYENYKIICVAKQYLGILIVFQNDFDQFNLQRILTVLTLVLQTVIIRSEKLETILEIIQQSAAEYETQVSAGQFKENVEEKDPITCQNAYAKVNNAFNLNNKLKYFSTLVIQSTLTNINLSQKPVAFLSIPSQQGEIQEVANFGLQKFKITHAIEQKIMKHEGKKNEIVEGNLWYMPISEEIDFKCGIVGLIEDCKIIKEQISHIFVQTAINKK